MAKEPSSKKAEAKVKANLWFRFLIYTLDVDEKDIKDKKIFKKVFSLTSLIGLLFILPAVASNITFDWIPMFDGIIKSFFTWSKRNPTPVFVGFNNFARVLSDKEFHSSLGNMMFFLIAGLLLMLPTIICCVVLFRIKKPKLQYAYRVMLCLPMVVPGLVFTLMWIFILGYDFGAINTLLQNMGLSRIQFLGNPDLIKWTILLTSVPFVSANTALIYLGGLNGISDSVWESASLDGVGPIRKFYKLEFPLILGQFKLALIGVIVAAITAYSQQLIFYNSSVHSGIITPGLLMYLKAFPNTGSPDYGYSYALGLILFVIALTISLLTMKFIKSGE